jgi:hypothetical protein
MAACEQVEAQTLLERFGQRLREAAEPLPEPLPLPAPDTPSPSVPAPTTNPALLGVVVSPITAPAIQQFRLPVRQGALITTIQPGSPADRAGLPIGGVIVAVDGVRIDTSAELVQLIRSSRAGRSIEIAYYNGSRLFRKQITLGPVAMPQDGSRVRGPATPPEPTPPPSVRRLDTPTTPRPLLERLGTLLGDLVPADGQPLTVEAPREAGPRNDEITLPDVPATSTEVEQLRSQVFVLQREVEQLKRRLAELERASEE